MNECGNGTQMFNICVIDLQLIACGIHADRRMRPAIADDFLPFRIGGVVRRFDFHDHSEYVGGFHVFHGRNPCVETNGIEAKRLECTDDMAVIGDVARRMGSDRLIAMFTRAAEIIRLSVEEKACAVNRQAANTEGPAKGLMRSFDTDTVTVRMLG